MNQEQNNLNQNNLNTQGNNGVPNNQPLNNQNFNQGMSFNQQPINSQPQPTSNFQQPINQMNMQQPTLQPVNNSFENVDFSNQNLNNKPPKKMNIGLIIGIITVIVVIGIGAVFGNKLISNKNNNNNSENANNTNTKGETVLKITPYVDEIPRYEITYPKSWKLYNGDDFQKNFNDIDYGAEIPKFVLLKNNIRIEFNVYANTLSEVDASNCNRPHYGYIENITINDLGNNVVLYSTLNEDNGVNLIMSIGYKSMIDYINESNVIDDNGYLINNKAYFCKNGRGINYNKKSGSYADYSMTINILFQDYYTRYNGSYVYQIIQGKTIDEIRNIVNNNETIKDAINILKTLKQVD